VLAPWNVHRVLGFEHCNHDLSRKLRERRTETCPSCSLDIRCSSSRGDAVPRFSIVVKVEDSHLSHPIGKWTPFATVTCRTGLGPSCSRELELLGLCPWFPPVPQKVIRLHRSARSAIIFQLKSSTHMVGGNKHPNFPVPSGGSRVPSTAEDDRRSTSHCPGLDSVDPLRYKIPGTNAIPTAGSDRHLSSSTDAVCVA